METLNRDSGRFKSYGITTLLIVGLSIFLHLFHTVFDLVNIALLYLFPVLLSAVRWGRGPSFYAAALGVLAFDFFFVPPTFSLSVEDLRYVFSFFVYLSVAALTASLASRLRNQFHQAQQREAHTAALYALSRKITAMSDLDALLHQIVLHVSETLDVRAAVFMPNTLGEQQLVAYGKDSVEWAHDDAHILLAAWVHGNNTRAGRGTQTLRESSSLFVPLDTDNEVHGVLAVQVGERSLAEMNEFIRMLEALADLSAVAISRCKLAQEAKLAVLTAESEKLRTALLDSLSHELRTPLATIIGSVTGLLEGEDVFGPEDRRELLLTTREGATRMNRLVGNLLGMVRIESGMLRLNKQWSGLEDIVGVAVGQLKDALQHRQVSIELAPDLPSVPLDEVLMEQVLINVISNAIKYSPEGSSIHILAVKGSEGFIELTIEDEGQGIPPGDRERIFEKFYRGTSTKQIPGTGLGLAICKSIVEAHGGSITATSRPHGERGTAIRICLPDQFAERDGDELDTNRGENFNH
ncbi:histidine kinase [Paenibacillus pectinilyticus]|uniref:histidine kinase n=1 Tax=Paenibacillus pectinilyticus TaxID=512399 RepID=A0A1C0ZSK8_9BACL|nr:ATP-binding protein [Paenibacillus pectinilyticus]OCT11065.1 histidine kinase [Paenibacillus pectinilyticus]